MNLEISDAFGLSQPITKLIEVSSRGLGRSTENFFRIRNAKAFSKELDIISDAFEKHGKMLGGIEYTRADIKVLSEQTCLPEDAIERYIELSQRSSATEQRLRMKRHANTESVIGVAAEELKDEEHVSDEPIDEDWLSLYFSIVENISSEHMQLLWGKVLAGEVKSPSNFSLRTLEFLKTLSSSEAELFSSMAKYAVRSVQDDELMMLPKKELRKRSGFDFVEYNHLKQLGLIEELVLSYNNLEAGASIFFCKENIICYAKAKRSIARASVNYTAFTKLGLDIYRLVEYESLDLGYMVQLLKGIGTEEDFDFYKGDRVVIDGVVKAVNVKAIN